MENAPHIQRMVDEEKELDTRMIALRRFTHTDIFKGLGSTDQALLVAQLSAMASYKEILTLRLGRALSA